MSSLRARLGQVSAARAIRGVLVVQLVIAVILVSRDVAGSFTGIGLAPDTPRLDAPVRPGDQTRRYETRRAPTLPARPGTGLPALNEMPSRLQFEMSGSSLSVQGEIAPGDAGRFADWLEEALPEAAEEDAAPITVALDSPGGSVGDALAIGRTLRARGFETEVGDGAVCLSACPYLLAAGTMRRVAETGYVGVHQHYFGESTVLPAWMAVEDIQRGQGEVLEYLDEMGIDPRLMRHSLATPPDQIYILLPDELADYALVTPEPEA
jgi:hypothetical protein